MLNLSIILAVVLGLALVAYARLAYEYWQQKKSFNLLANKFQTLLAQTENIAPAEAETNFCLTSGKDTDPLPECTSPILLGTLITVIINKLGDIRLTAKDFNLDDDDSVYIFVDTKTKDIILSTNDKLASNSFLYNYAKFSNSDDTTFH